MIDLLKSAGQSLLQPVLACAGLAAFALLVLEGRRWLAPLIVVLAVYALTQASWAFGALNNQREYARNPRRSDINELAGMVGAAGVVTKACDPKGQIRVDGELWQAKTAGESPIAKGAAVVVLGADSLVLEVEASE